MLLAGTRQTVPSLLETRRITATAPDETDLKVKEQTKDLYRAVDSTGQTIDFLLTAQRDAAAAQRFFRQAFAAPNNPVLRVINVDQNAAYPLAIKELKAEGTLPRCC